MHFASCKFASRKFAKYRKKARHCEPETCVTVGAGLVSRSGVFP